MSQKYILVIGGAASGKSAFAENLIVQSGLSRSYIATSRVWDEEMQTKVARHKSARGTGWQTTEAPLDISRPLHALSQADAVLVDCATMWLTNHLMDGSDLGAAEDTFRSALRACPALRVVVTNETGHGIVPADPLSRRFRQAQGELNQRLAADADTVVNVIAGLPQLLKGQL